MDLAICQLRLIRSTATFDQEIDTSSAKISLKDGAGNEIPVDVAPEGRPLLLLLQNQS